eukprot:6603056-Pyramimonas_sp.AAC.1
MLRTSTTLQNSFPRETLSSLKTAPPSSFVTDILYPRAANVNALATRCADKVGRWGGAILGCETA